ncbi:hypothetical protein [Tenacibaculum sp. IB213877]|uniref:hypothetical protein n=1 Tax=Tenacibaculum sp. IB213877 TaxID=3097351 RepID=UPI002A59B599|nr:hypothetical protein [Tenacibaculum sp. IB213877]MDY0780817.1 hypothetical protein [Tenacibaculum sp. IB213877]
MKNSILSLGKSLNKLEQQLIKGTGAGFCCEWCPDGSCLDWVSSPREQCPISAGC